MFDRRLSRFTLSRNTFRPLMAGLTLGFLLPRRELGDDQCELDLDPARLGVDRGAVHVPQHGRKDKRFRDARAPLLNPRSVQSSGL